MVRALIVTLLLGALAACRPQQAPVQTAIETAHVQWSRERQPEAFRCQATAKRTGRYTLDVSCGAALKTPVWCAANRMESCCFVVVGRHQTSSAAPRVCAQRVY